MQENVDLPSEDVSRVEDLDGVTLTLPVSGVTIKTMTWVVTTMAFLSAAGVAVLVGRVLHGWGWSIDAIFMFSMMLASIALWTVLKCRNLIGRVLIPRPKPDRIRMTPMDITLQQRKRTQRIMLSDVRGIDRRSHELLTRQGQRIPLTVAQEPEIQDWVSQGVDAWLREHLPRQGNTRDVPSALKTLRSQQSDR